MSFFKIKIKKNRKVLPKINVSGDKLITFVLICAELFCLIFFSKQDWISYLYFFSLVFYIIAVFYINKIDIFTGVGLHCIYMLVFVQSGVLMQELYYEIDVKVTAILLFYNFVAPLIMSILCGRRKRKICKDLNYIVYNKWCISLLFFVAVISMIIFYASVGFIPLFAPDGENARVIAMAGRGKFVVLASNCFVFSILLTDNSKIRMCRLVIASLLLIGVGYRSPMLELLLLCFIVFGIAFGKKFFGKAVIVVILLCFLYALFGAIRSGIDWNINGLYKPVLWRFFVNTSNIAVIIERYPIDQLTFGKSMLQDIAVVLPGAQETFMTSLKNIMDYQFSGGSLTPTVFGEGYYSWFYPGALIWPLIVLIFVIEVDRYCQRHIDGRLYYVFAYGLLGFTTTSFIPVFLNTLGPTIILYLFITKVGKKRRMAQMIE